MRFSNYKKQKQKPQRTVPHEISVTDEIGIQLVEEVDCQCRHSRYEYYNRFDDD